jgi:PAB-dependent poly(A)-specific ribonuclease subunit 2
MQNPASYHPSSASLPLPPLAFDAEFVSVEVEKVEIDARGQRIVHDEGRQVVARISIIECCPSVEPQFRLLVDDYILPIEPVVDYVTRFSGLHEEDLNPSLSRHAVVPNRTAYLKLKHFVDCGRVFVGHGLQKDFDIANIFVPPEQVSIPPRPRHLFCVSTPHHQHRSSTPWSFGESQTNGKFLCDF